MTEREVTYRITTMRKKQVPFSDQLRQAIRQSEKSRYRISKEMGISEAVLSRFMNQKVGLSMKTVDLLCECVGLRLVADDSLKQRKGR